MKPYDPAFPVREGDFGDHGVDIRLWIATHALQGLLSFRDYYGQTREPEREALAHADALLKAYNDECKE